MAYILEKQNDSIKVYSSFNEVEDTYNKINLRGWYIKKYNLNIPSLIVKAATPELYSKLDKLIDMVNLFKPRGAVPNKLVDWGEPSSTSILVRRGGKIEIGRRRSFGKSGVNVVPISNAEKDGNWGFFSDAKKYCGECGYEDPVYGGHHYYVPEGTPEYNKWSNWMTEKYNRLTNYAFISKEKPLPLRITPERAEFMEKLRPAHAYLGEVDLSRLISDWATAGLCRVSQGSKFIYDKNGYFVMELEEVESGDPLEAFLIMESYLEASELQRAFSITTSYMKTHLLDNYKK